MKLLIVDDHPVVRSGLRRLLAIEPATDIREAATGQDALSIFGEFRPDLVILDLNLPGMTGLAVIRRLKAADAAVRILVISMIENPIYVTRVLQAGATGYLSKNAPPEQILVAIKQVADGHTYIEHEIAQQIAISKARPASHPLADLSPRDIEILRLLGEGGSLLQIADAIGASYKTVANHCTQLKVRLGAARTADLVRIAISHGISKGSAGLTASLPDEVNPQS